MLYVGYMAVPAPESGALTVNLGNLRGVYNSAWIGGIIALLSSLLLSLPGFYLVKNAIARDRETRVGQILATTPLPKALYTLGKTVSNFIFLVVIVGLVMVAAGGMQLLRGEVTRIDVWHLAAPFLFSSLPALFVVAAVAVLFESVPLLRGGFGNIAYFVLYIVTITASLSGVTYGPQGTIEAPTNDLFGATVVGASMLRAAHRAYPQRDLELGVGYTLVEGPVATFRWDGVAWSAELILARFLWIGAAIGIALVAALVFDRFDPAKARMGRRLGLVQRLRGVLGRWREGIRARLPRLRLPPLPLPAFGRVVDAEMRMLLRGQRWWWYGAALGMVIGALTADAPQALHGLWVAAWIWPVLVWSKLGVRERQHRTAPVVFSAPRPLLRQLPATWLAGLLLSVVTGLGVGVRLLMMGDLARFAGWAVAALFIPTLALAAGVWSGSSKLFEALYVVMWYIGPVSGLAELDFMAANPASAALGMPWIYLGITVVLGALALLGRMRQVRR
jgi:hypothetical protein